MQPLTPGSGISHKTSTVSPETPPSGSVNLDGAHIEVVRAGRVLESAAGQAVRVRESCRERADGRMRAALASRRTPARRERQYSGRTIRAESAIICLYGKGVGESMFISPGRSGGITNGQVRRPCPGDAPCGRPRSVPCVEGPCVSGVPRGGRAGPC